MSAAATNGQQYVMLGLPKVSLENLSELLKQDRFTVCMPFL